jgi:TolA-binding protein
LRFAAAAVVCVAGQTWADDADRELRFASGLVEMGFADYSERLLDRMIRANPALADRAKAVQVEILLSRRKFDEAEKLAQSLPANLPATDAARLAIANGYYRIGEVEKAKALYQAFFDKNKDTVPSDPDVLRFYTDSAYRYGQMLEMANDRPGAIAAFEIVLRTNPPDALKRRIQYELAALCVRAAKDAEGAPRTALLDKATKLCDEIQWKGIDLWFGKSVIVLANIQLVKGSPDAAAETIRSYLDILDQVEVMLKEQELDLSLSPRAGARFMLGEIYFEQAGKLAAADSEKAVQLYTEALGHFLNVFAKYPESEWGPDAGIRTEQVVSKLKALGREVKIPDLGAKADKMAAAQMRMADAQYSRKDYAAAVRTYSSILSRFPLTSESPRALSNLLLSEVYLEREMEMKAVARQIAERYAGVPDAGLALLQAAKHYYDAKQKDLYVYLYDQFVTGFPKHPKTSSILFTLAGLLKKEGDAAGNRKYLAMLIENYPGDPYYFKARSLAAWNLYEEKKFKESADAFREVIGPSPPGHERGLAQFTLADCYLRQDRYADAVKEFKTLLQWLGPETDNPYGSTTDEIRKNRDMIEKSEFYIGYGLSRLGVEPKDLARTREGAIQQMQTFLKTYPKSELAPRAMSLIGTVQVELGRTGDAAKTFDDLARQYPLADEGRNARFQLIKSALEIQKPEIARDAFQKLIGESDKYTQDQILLVSQWMLDAGLFTEAAQGFEKVLAAGDTDRAVRERSLYGLGKAAYETGQYDVAVEKMGELLQAYPLSGLFFDAKFTLGRAHRDAGRLEDAVEALRDVFQRADTPLRGNTANLELARIQKKLAERATAAGQSDEAARQLKAAAGSYQRIFLFGDPTQPDIRPLVEESLLESIRILPQIGLYPEAMEACDQYMRVFPDGKALSDVRRLRAEINLKAEISAPPLSP